MNEILLIEPYDIVLEQYRLNRKIAIYSAKSVSYWGQAEEGRISKEISYPAGINQQTDIKKIKSKIDWWQPIWNRWIGSVDDYEIYRRTCLLYIINLTQILIEIKTKYAIFPTSVSHHVEYSLVETACQLAGVKQIYLYGTSFGSNGRLLPLLQDQSIQDRKILSVDISYNNAFADLQSYRDNFLQAKPPVHNEKADARSLGHGYAAFQIGKTFAKGLVKRFLSSSVRESRHFIDYPCDYNALSLLKMINKQKQSLEYYNAKSVNDTFVDDAILREGALPILFAHYQPEATSFPEGGIYSNHVDIVIEMRRLGYRGTILYKEHPASWIFYSKITGVSRVGMYRSCEYYMQLEALGCVFIKSSFQLKQKHILTLFPVTITGSIGVERSLSGLATCCAGEAWYKGAPGTCSIQEAFSQGGVFYDSNLWKFEPKFAMKWFDEKISRKTLNNYVGIATGTPSKSDSDRLEFLSEFDLMIEKLISRQA